MFIADRWNDYELLDATRGERLERFGEHILVRPDPQVIWDTGRAHERWETPDARYVRSASGGGRWERSSLPEQWAIGYDDMRFRIKPMGFKHTGVFPEQAANWDFITVMTALAKRDINALNLFAYTGGATLAAAKAGASVCHVDASKGAVAMARENLALSGLADRPVRLIVDDVRAFVQREIRRGSRYDVIMLDPPSFGRGAKGEVWKLEDDLYPLLRSVCELLSDNPLFVLLNSYTTGLSSATMAYMLNVTVRERFGGVIQSSELGLRIKSTGGILPAGSVARWLSEGMRETDRRGASGTANE